MAVPFHLALLCSSLLLLFACVPSAFDKVEGDRSSSAEGDAGNAASPEDDGECAGRPDAGSPIHLGPEDVTELAIQAEPAAAMFRTPGPSAKLGAKRVFVFRRMIMVGNGAVRHASAALEGERPPWRDDHDSRWSLDTPLDAEGIPLPLLPGYNDAEPLSLVLDSAGTGTLFFDKAVADPATGNLVARTHVARLNVRAAVTGDPVALFAGRHQFSLGGAQATSSSGVLGVRLYACEEGARFRDDPRDTNCYLVRAPLNRLDDPQSYEAYGTLGTDGDHWTSDLGAAVVVMHGPLRSLSVDWNNYLGKWVAVYATTYTGQLVVKTAVSPAGTWEELGEVTLPNAPFGVDAVTLHANVERCEDRLIVSYVGATAMLNGYGSATAGTTRYVSISLE